MKKLLYLLFAAFVAFAAFVLPDKVEAKTWTHPGVDGRGVAVLGETEVAVKSERVTVYTASSSLRFGADYELKNDAFMPKDVTFIYPIGEENYMDNYGFSVTADGEAVKGEIRHTAYFSEFDYENGLKISDVKRNGGFFTEDLPFTVYTYSAEEESEGEIKLTFGAEETRAFCEWGSYGYTGDGTKTVGVSLGGGREFKLYVAGKAVPAPAFKCKRGEIKFKNTAKTTLGALIDKPPEGVSEVDWYNAAISCMEHESAGGAVGGSFVFSPQCWLYRWYVYTLTVPAGGTVINTVSGDIYPSVNETYKPNLYTYGYASPPITPEEFTFTVLTEDFLYSGVGFEKTDGGFIFKGAKPQEQISVTLCSAEKPKRVVTPWEIFFRILAAVIILIIAAPIISVITVIIVRAVKKGKKNENL